MTSYYINDKEVSEKEYNIEMLICVIKDVLTKQIHNSKFLESLFPQLTELCYSAKDIYNEIVLEQEDEFTKHGKSDIEIFDNMFTKIF